MNTEFSDLILTICPHEQANAKDKNRVESMNSFFSERGACVEFAEINIKDGSQKTSMDYALEGSYKGKEIKLGISAKSITDFSATIGNLSNELARGFLRFDEVGFVLVTGCYTTTLSNDELHAIVKNPGAAARNQDDRADVLNTTSMFNALSSWERSGIHCRQVLYEESFPQAVMSILTFIAKDNHEGIGFNTKGVSDPIAKNKMNFVNAHVHMGVQGLGVQTALKLYNHMISRNNPPNLHYVSSISEEELQDAIGQKTGKALYEVYRCMAGWPFIVDEDSQGCVQIDYNDKSKVNIQSTTKITPKEFIIGLLIQNPSGIKYPELIGALKGAYPNSDIGELPDEFIENLIKEGICYEPILGLITIHPSYKQEKPFYSGDTAFLNENKQVFTEVKPNKVDISKLSQVNKGKVVNSVDCSTNTTCKLVQPSEERSEPHCSRSVDLGLQSSNIQSIVSHTESSSSSAEQDLKVDGTLGDGMDKSPSGLRDSAGDLSVVDGQNTTGLDAGRKAVIGNQPLSDVGSNPTYPTLQSQCDPAESEGFSKKPLSTLSLLLIQPSPANDNYKLQSQRERHKEMDAHSRNFSLDTLRSLSAEKQAGSIPTAESFSESKLGTPDTFKSSDIASIHDTAGKSLLKPPQLPQPVVSSTHKTKSKKSNISSDNVLNTIIKSPDIKQGIVGNDYNTDFLDNCKPEFQVRCRQCHQIIEAKDDDDSGFCHNPECIKSRNHYFPGLNTIKTLEDAIVDRVWNIPESDSVLIREFMMKGYPMPEIHKTIKESAKLHKYHQDGVVMVSYVGVKEIPEKDIGV